MASTYRRVRYRGMDLLSGQVRPVCFVRVSTPWQGLGVRVVCVALAGTVGAIGMLGHRRDGMAAPFAASGSGLVPGASLAGSILLGLTVHLAWMAVWSLVFAALAQRVRRPPAALVAVAVAGMAFVFSTIVGGGVAGPAATLPTAARAVVHIVLAVSLVIGLRLAPRG